MPFSSPHRGQSRNRHAVAVGIGDMHHPQLLSSSGTSSYDRRRGVPKTGRKHKATPGHQLLAIVTAETGEKMVYILQDMTAANREMESRRLDFEKSTHEENMAYKRERDNLEAEHKKQALLN